MIPRDIVSYVNFPPEFPTARIRLLPSGHKKSAKRQCRYHSVYLKMIFSKNLLILLLFSLKAIAFLVQADPAITGLKGRKLAPTEFV